MPPDAFEPQRLTLGGACHTVAAPPDRRMKYRLLFYLAGTTFWIYGIARFVNLPPVLANRGRLKRWMWILVLASVGIFAGLVLDQDRIQSKAALGLLLVPVLAWIDDRAVYSERQVGFWFFFAICFFEIYTVFLVAAAVRLAIDHI